ncbi:hypothetical protein C8Q75DRAFT_739751 [Abortiporus biennis]|nr:hypothetical protein C8Q75DRAFT_739751 [Abortiporus biennis]
MNHFAPIVSAMNTDKQDTAQPSLTATSDVEGTPKKKAKTEPTKRSALVELKNGRPVFKQKQLSLEKMSETMQEMVKFRELLEQKLESKSEEPLTSIPDEHKPLIVKLVYESEKTLPAISKSIQHNLLPPSDPDSDSSSAALLPIDVIEKTIKSLMTRVDYGLELKDIPGIGIGKESGGKVPASWHLWRWEVKDEFRDWLPKSVREKVEGRVGERKQAKESIKALFESFTPTERDTVLGIKSNTGKDKSNVDNTVDLTLDIEVKKGGNQRDSRTPVGDEGTEHDTPSKKAAAKAKKDKIVDLEKMTKEKEKQERKNAKLEKEKKEKESQDKSRSLMASFFNRAPKHPKASSSSSSTLLMTPSRSASSSKLSSSGKTEGESGDFEKTFRPFLVKKDVELAPIKWFENGKMVKRRGNGKDRERNYAGKTVIVIDDDEERRHKGTTRNEDVFMIDAAQEVNVQRMDARERLQESISRLKSLSPDAPHLRPRHPNPSGLKIYHPHTVRSILNQLSEAEITGDISLVRSLLAALRDRSLVPIKVLIFDEDLRPGYFGTWTRNSMEVGPRTWKAKDVIGRDYTYDSGEEWEEGEEEGEGEEVDDGDEDGDGKDEEADSDLDSWLVDDDDDVEPGTPIEDRELSLGMDVDTLELPVVKPKRKVEEESQPHSKGMGKKRKVVVPLVPFTKGPCYEDKIGKFTYEPFSTYSLQLCNDTPFPINPFTWVSRETFDQHPPVKDGPFVLPALPPHIKAQSASTTIVPATLSTSTTLTQSMHKPPPPKPKTTFPDIHLPLLISKMASMNTGSITGIVETVFHELKDMGVRKNAIEAKVREIGVKSKEKKVWVVKEEFADLSNGASEQATIRTVLQS